MKRLTCRILLTLLCCCFLMASCDEIIEPSLSKRVLSLQAPAEGYLSSSYSVGFWWDEVEDALSYRLQVVSGSFSRPGQLVADTMVKQNRFILTLDPGEYQWRVRAENGSSETAFSEPRNLTVLSSSIKGQTVRLLTPGDGVLLNSEKTDLLWSRVFGANLYHLQIDSNSFSDPQHIVYDALIPATSFSFTPAHDQRYQWRVMAKNDTADSKWSVVQIFTIDRVAPPKSDPLLPVNRGQVTMPAVLHWNTSPGAVKYRLSILKSDSTTSYNQSYPVDLKEDSYTFKQGLPGEKIVWRVSSIDAAGNMSGSGKIFSFNVQ